MNGVIDQFVEDVVARVRTELKASLEDAFKALAPNQVFVEDAAPKPAPARVGKGRKRARNKNRSRCLQVMKMVLDNPEGVRPQTILKATGEENGSLIPARYTLRDELKFIKVEGRGRGAIYKPTHIAKNTSWPRIEALIVSKTRD